MENRLWNISVASNGEGRAKLCHALKNKCGIDGVASRLLELVAEKREPDELVHSFICRLVSTRNHHDYHFLTEMYSSAAARLRIHDRDLFEEISSYCDWLGGACITKISELMSSGDAVKYFVRLISRNTGSGLERLFFFALYCVCIRSSRQRVATSVLLELIRLKTITYEKAEDYVVNYSRRFVEKEELDISYVYRTENVARKYDVPPVCIDMTVTCNVMDRYLVFVKAAHGHVRVYDGDAMETLYGAAYVSEESIREVVREYKQADVDDYTLIGAILDVGYLRSMNCCVPTNSDDMIDGYIVMRTMSAIRDTYGLSREEIMDAIPSKCVVYYNREDV